jgi:hypothetical protein
MPGVVKKPELSAKRSIRRYWLWVNRYLTDQVLTNNELQITDNWEKGKNHDCWHFKRNQG